MIPGIPSIQVTASLTSCRMESSVLSMVVIRLRLRLQQPAPQDQQCDRLLSSLREPSQRAGRTLPVAARDGDGHDRSSANHHSPTFQHFFYVSNATAVSNDFMIPFCHIYIALLPVPACLLNCIAISPFHMNLFHSVWTRCRPNFRASR